MCDYERGHLVLRADVAELVLCRSMASRACAPCIIKASLTEQNSHSKHHIILSLHVCFQCQLVDSEVNIWQYKSPLRYELGVHNLYGVSQNGYFVIFIVQKDEGTILWRTINLYSITLTDTYVFTRETVFLKYQLYYEELIRLVEEGTNSKIPQQLFS